MTRKAKCRALPVLAPSDAVRCDRLSATITVATCAARWTLAQDRSTQRFGRSTSGRGEAGLPYTSCRKRADGKARAEG